MKSKHTGFKLESVAHVKWLTPYWFQCTPIPQLQFWCVYNSTCPFCHSKKQQGRWNTIFYQEGNIFLGTKVLTKQFLSAAECGSGPLICFFSGLVVPNRSSDGRTTAIDHIFNGFTKTGHFLGSTKTIDFSPLLKRKGGGSGIFPKSEKVFPTLKIRTQRIFWYPKSSRIIPLDVWWFYGLTFSDSSQAEGFPQSCLCIWWTCDNKHPPFSVVLCGNHYWGTPGSNVRHS